MPFHDRWKEIQIDFLSTIEDEIYPSGCDESREFASYFDSYRASIPSSWVATEREEILRRAHSPAVFLVGDYHTHPASAATMLWLIDRLSRSGHRLALFLEAVPDGFHDSVAAYQKGDQEENEFLETVGYGACFGFDWGIYRPLVIESSSRGIPLFGINTRAASVGLAIRDDFAAGIIAREMAGDEPITALVLIGERHLAPPHLPRSLRRALAARGVRSPIVTIHRNIESVYFDSIGPEGGSIPSVAGNPSLCLGSKPWDGNFLIQDVSPLTLKAGDLNWFRCRENHGRYPDTGLPEEGVKVVFDFDEVSLFGKALEYMASLFYLHESESGAALFNDAVNDFHIFTGEDLYFLERFEGDGMAPERLAWLQASIADPGFFYLPEYRLAYMRHLSPAAMGATAIHHLAAARNRGVPCGNTFLTAVRDSLGTALFDPCAAGEPSSPVHPMLRPAGKTVQSLDCEIGSEIGLDLFRGLVAGSIPARSVSGLLEDEDTSLEALSEILAAI